MEMVDNMKRRLDKDGCVLTCTVTECAYNEQEGCMAPDIVVGDDHPMCDTFTTGPVERSDHEAMVGACNVVDCTYNSDRDCNARGITVAHHSSHADCLTFRP